MSIVFSITESIDYEAIVDFLTRQQLPTEDLPPKTQTLFALAHDGQALVGTAAIELWQPFGLLRSLAVEASYRRQRIADELVAQLLEKAQHRGIQSVYLITTTAEAYFSKRGFEAVERVFVPPMIAQTQQFAGLCPSSAVIMKSKPLPSSPLMLGTDK